MQIQRIDSNNSQNYKGMLRVKSPNRIICTKNFGNTGFNVSELIIPDASKIESVMLDEQKNSIVVFINRAKYVLENMGQNLEAFLDAITRSKDCKVATFNIENIK